MQSSLVYLLVALLLYAALLYYFLFVRRERDLGAWGKSGLVVILFMLVPVLLIVLWEQSRSVGRLEALGFNAHPGFVSSVGVSAGVGVDPTWMFTTREAGDSILGFYRQPENHQGWSLTAEAHNRLVLERPGERMRIHVSGDTVVFLLQAREGDPGAMEGIGDRPGRE